MRLAVCVDRGVRVRPGTVGLPQGVAEDQIAATYTNGVLEITVPKPEQQKPRRIEISVDGAQPTIEA